MIQSSSSNSFLKKLSVSKFLIIVAVITTCIILMFKMGGSSDCLEEEMTQNNIRTQLYKQPEFLHSISKYKVSHSIPGLQLYIYTAFLDERYDKTVLRIFALEEKGGVSVDFKCKYKVRYVKMKNDVIREVPAKRYWIDSSWPVWSPYFASEYNCAVPLLPGNNMIVFVSTDGRYEFNIPIETPNKYRMSKRKKVGVCIKPLTGFQSSVKLIEWLETLSAAGYKDIIIYQSDLTGPGRHILEYYEQKGLVNVINFPYLISVVQNVERPGLTDQQRFAIYQQIYLIALHDCLYRFSSMYQYLSIQDMDEVIIPEQEESISDMIIRAEKVNPHAAGFMFKTCWHFEDFGVADTNEKLLYMQQYAKSTSPTDNQPKSIISTDRTITLNFHEVLDVPRKSYESVLLTPFNYGTVHHFRGKCLDKFNKEVCKTMLSDIQHYNTMSKYRDVARQQVKKVMSHLQMK